MKCQIIRHQTYSRTSLANIGRENHRNGQEQHKHKNENIDRSRSHLNINMGIKTNLHQRWEDKIKELGIEKPKHKESNFAQLMITASPEFFKECGWSIENAKNWKSSDECPREIMQYFQDALTFTKEWVGAENILSVHLHFDESSPNLHVNFVPVFSGQKRKNVWARDQEGKLLRNDKGEKIRARDQEGRVIYEYVETGKIINNSEFMKSRGGSKSYRNLQDLFFEEVGKKHGLERGEIGSKAKHRNHHEYSREIEENALIINGQKEQKQALKEELREITAMNERAKATMKNFELDGYIKAINDLDRACKMLDHSLKEVEKYKKSLYAIKDFAKTHEIEPLPPYIDRVLDESKTQSQTKYQERSR